MKIVLATMYTALLAVGVIFLKPAAVIAAMISVILYYFIDEEED